MILATPVSGIPSYMRIPGPGETAPFAMQMQSSFNEMQTVIRQNPTLEFGSANTLEESISIDFTNVAQLAEKNGDRGELAAILKSLKIGAPSAEQLKSHESIKEIQKEVQSRLSSMSNHQRDDVSQAISAKFDQLVHEAAMTKGSLVNTSA